MKQILLLFALMLSAIVISEPGRAQVRSAEIRHIAAKPAKRSEASEPEVAAGARVIRYGEKDVVRINAKVRFQTLIVLPKEEQILDFACGDKEFWVIDGNVNIAYVKPAKPGLETDLNLVTASGNIYSFLLVEVSDNPDSQPDLKVFIEPKEESMISAANGTAQFVSARELDNYRQQLAIAKDETRRVEQAADSAIDAGVSRFVANMRFPYRFEAGKKPFFVRAMYNDDKFTYIQARPEETPTLYEIKDGKPNLVNFEYRNGAYVVGKVLARGYLVIGKAKLGFEREE